MTNDWRRVNELVAEINLSVKSGEKNEAAQAEIRRIFAKNTVNNYDDPLDGPRCIDDMIIHNWMTRGKK